MKYKLEFWRYGLFDYEEAEKHLNRMSEEGWDIEGVATEWFPLAVYQKRLGGRKTCYSIVPIKENDTDFVRICEDAGWRKVRAIRSGLCIFEAKDKNAKQPFTDEMTKYQNVLEVAESTNPLSGLAILAIVLLINFFQDFKSGWGSTEYYVLAGICMMAMLSIVLAFKEYRFHKKAAEYAEEGINLQKSPIYKYFGLVSCGGAVIIGVGLIVYLLYCYINIYPSVLGIILTAATPFIFLLGGFLRAAKHFDVTGILLMYISIISPGFVLLLVEGI